MLSKTILIVLIFFLSMCKLNINSNKESSDLIESLNILALRGNRANISGTVLKGVVRKATVTLTALDTEGNCNSSSVLAVGTTGDRGDYSVSYNRIGSVVCLMVTPNQNGLTTMYDEKSGKDLSIPTHSKFRMVQILPESKISGNSKKNLMISPFSRIISKRLQFLIKQNPGQDISRLHSRASRELVIRFGLNKGLTTSSKKQFLQPLPKSISEESVLEFEEILLQLDDPNSSTTAKFVSILVGISHLASKYKNGNEVSAEDLDEIIEAFAADFADGIFDGKGPDGQSISIGSGTNQIIFSSDPLATVLFPAIVNYFQEGGTLSVGIPTKVPPPTVSPEDIISQIQFAGNTPIISTDLVLVSPNVPPSGLSYGGTNFNFIQNQSITPLIPSITGTVTFYSVSPALPTGLTLNTSTGVISGTPTNLQTSSTYIVTATNSTGSTSFSLNIAIVIPPPPPSGLSYPSSNYNFKLGAPICSLTPSVTGSSITFSVSPPLPSGLSLNPSTGQISGTPSVTLSAYNYTVTASNSTGSTDFVLTLSVGTMFLFTNAGQTGRTGPTQTQVNSAYGCSSLDSVVTINTQGIQEWDVPSTGTYRLEVAGAQGGSTNSKTGGLGAKIIGDFTFTLGQTLKILVGQSGYMGGSGNRGGGGGSFVWNASDNTLFIAAGGGGGAGGALSNGVGGSATTSGTQLANGSGTEGTGGNGSHGAGWLSDGVDGTSSGVKAVRPLVSGIGGAGYSGYESTHFGGFGGGGGGGGAPSTTNNAGGGGGYSGGAGETGSGGEGGGGGGSYNSGTNPSNTAAINTGHGYVKITKL